MNYSYPSTLTKSVKQHSLFPGVHNFIIGVIRRYQGIHAHCFPRMFKPGRRGNTGKLISLYIHLCPPAHRGKQTTGLSNSTPAVVAFSGSMSERTRWLSGPVKTSSQHRSPQIYGSWPTGLCCGKLKKTKETFLLWARYTTAHALLPPSSCRAAALENHSRRFNNETNGAICCPNGRDTYVSASTALNSEDFLPAILLRRDKVFAFSFISAYHMELEPRR